MGLFDALGAGLQIGLNAFGASKERSLARNQNRIEEARLRENKDANLRELDRQASRVPQTFAEKRSDTMRSAAASIGRLGAFASEAGTSESTSTRLLNEVRFVRGQDLARIDFEEREELEAIDAAAEAVETGFGADIAVSRNRRDASITQSWLGFGTSALQIGGLWYGRWAERQAATNRID